MIKKLLVTSALLVGFLNSFGQCTGSILQSSIVACQGSSNTYINATPGGNMYVWYQQGLYYGTTLEDSILVNTSLPGTQTYEVVISFNSCVDTSNSVPVTIVPLPTVTATSNGPLCEGQTVNVYASPVTGATYAWMGPIGLTSTFQNASFANATLAHQGWYYVAVTVGGCVGLDSVYLSVDAIPPAPIVSSSGSNCSGGTVQLSATSIVMGCPLMYQWYGPNSYTSTMQNPVIPNTTTQSSGNYYCIVTSCLCSSPQGSVTVTINQTPAITATQINPTTLTSSDGAVVISGVTTGIPYLVNYSKNGNPQPAMTQTASNGNIVIGNLTVGTYDNITVSYNGCPSNIVGPYILTAMTTTSDSVWPGDVNYDLVADNNDALDLALAYGQTGTVRTGASNTWVAQYSADWGTMQVCNYDMKHADCNGDGTVDANDTTAISLNYGQVHLKGEHVPMAKSAAAPDLYFDVTGINFVAGTTVNVPIKLGTSSFPMNNIMGIAANVHVSNIALNSAPTIDASTSWMGSGGNLLNFTKGVGTNQADWTLARTDHNNVSGDGTIAMLTIDIPTGVQGQDIVLYMDDVKMIDNNGNVITNYNVVDDTATVLNISSANVATEFAAVAPNPSGNEANLHIRLEQGNALDIAVTDVTGRTVWTKKVKANAGTNIISLPAAQLAQGSYFVKINNDKNTVNLSLKWQKR